MNVAPLQTERLILREFEKSDWKGVHEYASDPEVVKFMDWGPNSEQGSKDFVRKVMKYQKDKSRRDFDFAVILRGGGRLIGACGIHVSNPDNREAWMGYCFCRTAWGKGYAIEAARALLRFGIGELKLHRIFATCDPVNVASARVLEKAGMKREGLIRQHKWVKGSWRDSYLYAILENEWGRE